MSLKLNGSNSGFTEIDAPAVAGSNTITLPASNGSANQYLRNSSTAGVLEFTDGGKILQVLQTVKTDVTSFTSTNSNTFQDISGMSVSITPTSSSSKILVLYTANVSQSTTATIHLRLQRGSTSIFQAAADGNRIGSTQIVRVANTPYEFHIATVTGSFLDSPSTTSTTTYKLTGTLGSTYSGTFYLNRAKNDLNADYAGRTASSITVMEVAA